MLQVCIVAKRMSPSNANDDYPLYEYFCGMNGSEEEQEEEKEEEEEEDDRHFPGLQNAVNNVEELISYRK